MKLQKILILLALVLLLSACGGRSSGSGHQEVDDDFRSGTTALQMRFMPDAPPREVYQEQQLRVDLELHNKGGNDIRGGTLSVNYDDSVLESNTQTIQRIDVDGRSPDNPQGERYIEFFSFIAKSLPSQSQRRTTEVVATACYTFHTTQRDVVCVDNDPYNIAETEKPCTLSDVSLGTGGGPLNVERAEVFFREESTDLLIPEITFHIKNSGRGVVYEPGWDGTFCSSVAAPGDIVNHIYFEANFSNDQLFCDEQFIKLIDGSVRVRCVGNPIDVSATTSYETSLSTSIAYGYAESESTKFDIIR
ncbi:MAG: hypothetical protein ACI8Y7_000313 [Candidatus Woesearchaeota archaeon]|jgi:hypothetical protein